MDHNKKKCTSLQNWSKDEKLNLYHAIKQHGYQNVNQISNSLPNKTDKEVADAIQFYKNIAFEEKDGVSTTGKLRKNHTTIPLNNWAKLLLETYNFDELTTDTATALRLIADFERIPPPSYTEDIDFRKIYHMLANALESKALPEDNTSTFVINKCLVETALISREFMKNSNHRNAVNEIRINETIVPTFAKPTDNDDLTTLRQIANQKNYNPLNIPEQHLKFT